MHGGSRPAVRVDDLGKRYDVGTGVGAGLGPSLGEDLRLAARRLLPSQRAASTRSFWAVRHVGFDIAEGERVGIIGRNGAGKSTLLKLLTRVTTPTEGVGDIWGRVGSLLEVGTGFHLDLTGRDNIFLSGSILGMRRKEIERKVDEIVEFSGVGPFLHTPVKRYSSGMYLRLAFAVAAHLEPDVLVVDEVLAVGDADFQRKCLGRMDELGQSGRTVLFVSHSMDAISRLCDRVLLLDRGGLVADGAPGEVIRAYRDAGLGDAPERVWDGCGPSDDLAQLRRIAIRSCGEVREAVDIRSELEVEVVYELGPHARTRPSVELWALDDDGILLFRSSDHGARAGVDRPGLFRSTCTIPGNLLAEGGFHLDVHLTGYDPKVVHAIEQRAASVQVIDRSEGDGVRGEVAERWPGALRPALAWSRHEVGNEIVGG